MARVKQTRFGDPKGNCLPACVVSILDMPEKLEELSDFLDEKTDWMGQRLLLAKWLEPLGFTCVPFLPWEDKCEEFIKDITCIAGGISSRGLRHAVVWKNGLVFDPHPDGDGIETVETYTLLIRTDE